MPIDFKNGILCSILLHGKRIMLQYSYFIIQFKILLVVLKLWFSCLMMRLTFLETIVWCFYPAFLQIVLNKIISDSANNAPAVTFAILTYLIDSTCIFPCPFIFFSFVLIYVCVEWFLITSKENIVLFHGKLRYSNENGLLIIIFFVT